MSELKPYTTISDEEIREHIQKRGNVARPGSGSARRKLTSSEALLELVKLEAPMTSKDYL